MYTLSAPQETRAYDPPPPGDAVSPSPELPAMLPVAPAPAQPAPSPVRPTPSPPTPTPPALAPEAGGSEVLYLPVYLQLTGPGSGSNFSTSDRENELEPALLSLWNESTTLQALTFVNQVCVYVCCPYLDSDGVGNLPRQPGVCV